MNRTFITNLTHFLDEKGAVPDQLAKPARQLVENLGAIVTHMTRHASGNFHTHLPCWGRLGRKACPGTIEAGVRVTDFAIIWYCPTCEDKGLITHWEGSFFDCSEDIDRMS